MTATPDSFAAVVAELRRLTSPNPTCSSLVRHAELGDMASRIERLDAEMQQVRQYNVTLTQRCVEDTAELGELRARLAACEKDAARYQWLRNSALNQHTHPICVSQELIGNDHMRYVGPLSFKELDESIDKALASRPSPGAMGGEGEK